MATENETKDDEKFHDDLAAEISKDMDNDFNTVNIDNKEKIPEWSHLSEYDGMQFDQWQHSSFIRASDDILVIYNRRFNEKGNFQGFHMYSINKNEWKKSSPIHTEKHKPEEKIILVTNSAVYDPKKEKIFIYEQGYGHYLIEYDLNTDSWRHHNICKDKINTGKVSGYGKNDWGPIGYNWTDKPAQVVINKKEKNKIYIFSNDWGYKSWEYSSNGYFDRKSHSKETTKEHKNSSILSDNSFGDWSEIIDIICIENKQLIYAIGQKGGSMFKFDICAKKWSKLANICIPFSHIRMMKDESEKYIILYSGWYSEKNSKKNSNWGKGLRDHSNTGIYIFDVSTETLTQSKITVPFKVKRYGGEDNYYGGIIINNIVYIISRKGSLWKIKLNSILSYRYNNNNNNKYIKYINIVKDIDIKRRDRKLDINDYIKDNTKCIILYSLFLCYLDYAFSGNDDIGASRWISDEYNMSLSPPIDPDHDTINLFVNNGIEDPFDFDLYNIYNEWNKLDDNKKIERYKQLINLVYHVQRASGRGVRDKLHENYGINAFGHSFRCLNEMERKVVLCKLFHFIGNDLIRLGIDGIREMAKEIIDKKDKEIRESAEKIDDYKLKHKDLVYSCWDNVNISMTFELYKIDYNNNKIIGEINALLNGTWNRYKIYQIEPWPTFGIGAPKLCNKYKFIKTIGFGRTCSRVIEAIPLKKDEEKKEEPEPEPDRADAPFNNNVAIKIISKNNNNNALIYKNEVNIMNKIGKHRNIATFIDNTEDDLNYYIVYKLYDGYELPHKCKQSYYQIEMCNVWLKDILLMTKELHSNNIIVRDMKFEDFILPCKLTFSSDIKNYPLKLFDLGYAKIINDNDKYNKEIIDKYNIKYAHYIAPELLINPNNKITGKELKICDIWQIGVLFYMMLTGKPPYINTVNDKLILPLEELNTSNTLPIALIHLLKRLLTKDPKKRISIKHALTHPWYTGDYLAPEPWIELKKCPFEITSGSKINPYLYSINNKYIILYGYLNGTYCGFFDSEYKKHHAGFYIYNILKDEWYKSPEIPVKTTKSMRNHDDEYKLIIKFWWHTIKYNNNTNILTLYEEQFEKLMEYNLNNNKWIVDTYKKRLICKPPKKDPNDSDLYIDGEQCVFVNDKIHIFTLLEEKYKHYIIDYKKKHDDKFDVLKERIDITKNDKFDFGDEKINDDKDPITLKQFNFNTYIIYCKLMECLYVIYYRGPKMFKYSLLTKTWTIIKNIDINLRECKPILCNNDQYLLMYGCAGKYGNSLRSRDIYLFDTQTEILKQCNYKAPFEDSTKFAAKQHKFVAINVNESTNKNEYVLLNGYIRNYYKLNKIPKSILNLISSFISNESIYMISMEGVICKIDLSQLMCGAKTVQKIDER